MYTGKMYKWVLMQIKAETFLEAKLAKLKLTYFGHIIRQDSLEKATLLGNRSQQGKRKPKCEME